MKYDLHMHTIYSDGGLTPKELINKVKRNGLRYMAITDHNNIEGSRVACSLENNDITIIPAVEMEGIYDNGKLHILGYNVDLNNERLNQVLNMLNSQRKKRAKFIINELKRVNVFIPQEEQEKIDHTLGDVGKPYIANLLVKYGYASDIKNAFDCYLDSDDFHISGTSFVLSKDKVIDTIRKADGIPVLAHFTTLNKSGDDLEDFLKELISLGLMGIETGHSCFKKEDYLLAKKLARKYDLLETGGSDYHGPIAKRHIKIATWYTEENEEKIPSMLTFLENNQKIKKI